MIHNTLSSEHILTQKDRLILDEGQQEYLENDALTLIRACVRENGRGLDFQTLIQDCLIVAANALTKYDSSRIDTKLSTYIWKSCLNKIKMEWRKNSSYKAQVEQDTISFESSRLAYSFDSTEEYLEEKEEHDQQIKWLNDAMQKPSVGLTSLECTIISLTRQGFTQHEISREVKLSQSQVSIWKTAALQKLLAALELDRSKGEINF